MEITGIVLAKGAPNRTRDGSTVMCSIVLSSEIGLVRLYPLAVSSNADIRIWSRIRCDATKTNKDNRVESFRVHDSEVVGQIESSTTKSDILNSCHLRSGTEDPIDYQNSKRASICVIKVDGNLGASLECRTIEESVTGSDDDAWVIPQCNFPYKPYVVWKSMQGKTHRTHLLAQEVYVGMQKNASTPFRIFENMNIGDPDYQHWMVLGNMKDKRNIWVMAHLHRLKKTSSVTTTSFLTIDGENASWPYSQQEVLNAKIVNPQMEFNFTT